MEEKMNEQQSSDQKFEEKASMFCNSCGTKFERNAESCPQCGMKRYLYYLKYLNKYSSLINLLTFIMIVIIFFIIIQW